MTKEKIQKTLIATVLIMFACGIAELSGFRPVCAIFPALTIAFAVVFAVEFGIVFRIYRAERAQERPERTHMEGFNDEL